ncbi:hypothetical protein Scel_25140 [Streptomyces cellostaticus]|nr:hypothetical protein Scel_25140 [Streptomyces cellostaticus]
MAHAYGGGGGVLRSGAAAGIAPPQYRALRRTGREAHTITGRAMIRVLGNARRWIWLACAARDADVLPTGA